MWPIPSLYSRYWLKQQQEINCFSIHFFFFNFNFKTLLWFQYGWNEWIDSLDLDFGERVYTIYPSSHPAVHTIFVLFIFLFCNDALNGFRKKCIHFASYRIQNKQNINLKIRRDFLFLFYTSMLLYNIPFWIITSHADADDDDHDDWN